MSWRREFPGLKPRFRAGAWNAPARRRRRLAAAAFGGAVDADFPKAPRALGVAPRGSPPNPRFRVVVSHRKVCPVHVVRRAFCWISSRLVPFRGSSMRTALSFQLAGRRFNQSRPRVEATSRFASHALSLTTTALKTVSSDRYVFAARPGRSRKAPLATMANDGRFRCLVAGGTKSIKAVPD